MQVTGHRPWLQACSLLELQARLLYAGIGSRSELVNAYDEAWEREFRRRSESWRPGVPRLRPHAHWRDRGDRAERAQQHAEQGVVVLPDDGVQ